MAQEKFRNIDNKKIYAESLLALAKEYCEKGDIGNAIKYSEKTLRIYKEMNNSFYVSEN